MGVSLDYKGTDFSISKKCYHKTKSKNDISINKFENHIKKLLIRNKDKSYTVYIKNLNGFMNNKKSHNNKKCIFV